MQTQLLTSKERQARKPRGKPQHLPEVLKPESMAVKAIYLFLKGRGEVDYSITTLAQALGCSREAVQNSMMRLRQIELMEYEGKPKGNAKYRVKVL